MSHEETQHDGTAQSVVIEIIPRNRQERPDADPQREARQQQFVIGNDEAELENFSGIKIIREPDEKDQVRKRQKRISNVTQDGRNHSMIW